LPIPSSNRSTFRFLVWSASDLRIAAQRAAESRSGEEPGMPKIEDLLYTARPALLVLAFFCAAAPCLAGVRGIQTADANRQGRSAAVEASLPRPLRSVLGAAQWLNTRPLRAEDLRGKVVLVNFWTYSCINSLRPLPYVRAWADKYRDQGLVVVGVHTPEFAFEKDVANVRPATASLGVGYPVALDSDYAIWRAFSNQAWPAFYFVDAKGRVRRQVLGEGGYDKSERLLQQLLSEARGRPVTGAIAPVAGKGPQAAPDERNLGSPETYVGYAQASNFASPGGARRDAPSRYRTPSPLRLNTWGLTGAWTVGGEFATLNEPSGAIAFRFHARDLHLVMGPTPRGRPVRFRVTIDGAPPGANHGWDVDAEGWGSVREPRMYQLVRQAGRVADRTFQIEFLEPGVRAYVFTFG
jgi:thiol-disulfide isomerase/thioredoxin